MGTWSPVILGNDTSCEVYERFFELYNSGEDANVIANIVLEEQQENLEYDATNIWFGLALACWECKVLTAEIYTMVKQIIDSGRDIQVNAELEASNAFLRDRKKKLNEFLLKISSERDKAKARKKIPKQIDTPYKAGMCLVYRNREGRYIRVYVTESEHTKNSGEIRFLFLEPESEFLPTLESFMASKLYGLKKLGDDWGEIDYKTTETGFGYNKKEKEDLFACMSKIFIVIGQLDCIDYNKMVFNFRGRHINFADSDSALTVIEEIRKELQKATLSDLTLGELLEQTGIKMETIR